MDKAEKKPGNHLRTKRTRWLAVSLVLACGISTGWLSAAPVSQAHATGNAPADSVLQKAYASHQSNLQVEGSGRVVKVLMDDLEGIRHQRFILKLASGLTVIVAHNIDLAPRVENLKAGDTVDFSGEYEWNEKGGVIHWTHRDPGGRHKNGWLKHDGKTYQ